MTCSHYQLRNEELKKMGEQIGKEYCHRCGYCLPCTQGIFILGIMDFLKSPLLPIEKKRIAYSSILENIMPALDTEDPTRPGHRAWCWFLGVPEGLGHYYDMCRRAESKEDDDFRVPLEIF